MTNLDSVLKSKDITLPIKVCIAKAVVFPVVMYGCESWTTKKAEHPRIDAFELWCWRRLLRVSWTARKSIQSIPKEISPEYSLAGLMLKLKLQYFGYLMWTADFIGKDTDAGKDWRQKEKRVAKDEMVGWNHWFNGHELGQTPGDGEGLLLCWRLQRVRHYLATERQIHRFAIYAHACGVLSCFSHVQLYRPIEFNSCDPIDCSSPGSSVHSIL